MKNHISVIKFSIWHPKVRYYLFPWTMLQVSLSDSCFPECQIYYTHRNIQVTNRMGMTQLSILHVTVKKHTACPKSLYTVIFVYNFYDWPSISFSVIDYVAKKLQDGWMKAFWNVMESDDVLVWWTKGCFPHKLK